MKNDNTDNFSRIVVDLKSELLIDNTDSHAGKTAQALALESRILAVTKGLEQEPSLSQKQTQSKPILWFLRPKFVISAVSIVTMAIAIFVLLPVADLPSQASLSLVDSDLTFQELWLAEDELLFSDAI